MIHMGRIQWSMQTLYVRDKAHNPFLHCETPFHCETSSPETPHVPHCLRYLREYNILAYNI